MTDAWKCKLTPAQVKKIRAICSKPFHRSMRSIAREFGVAPATIWRIATRKTWDE